jgi:hypothetical protein
MNTKHLTKLCYFLIAALVFISCSKEEEVKTDGELIGKQIRQLITEENILLVRTYLVDYINNNPVYLADEEETGFFEIDGQIIKVNQTYYNLNKLLKYRIDTSSDTDVLSLYFDGYQ